MRGRFALLAGLVLGVLCVLACLPPLRFVAAQNPREPSHRAAMTSQDEERLEVIEIFDAKYAGDTPGCVAVQKAMTPPRVALGDAVYRNEEMVGHVTAAAWSRETHVLRIEFDPSGGARTFLSDTVRLPTSGR